MKKARVEHLYAIADGEVIPEDGEPEVIFCMDEFGPLNLIPHPGRQWAERGGRHKDPDREPRRRRRATYNRYGGVRHLFAALDLAKDKLYGHIKPVKRRTQFLEFCRYLRTLYPPKVRIALPSSRGESHPSALTEPCVTVSRYTALVALIIRSVRRPRCRRQCANMRGYRWAISCIFARAFRLAASRLYFWRIQRTR